MIIATRMTRNPVTATPMMSVGEAADLMKREKVHRLPVLDKELDEKTLRWLELSEIEG